MCTRYDVMIQTLYLLKRCARYVVLLMKKDFDVIGPIPTMCLTNYEL